MVAMYSAWDQHSNRQVTGSLRTGRTFSAVIYSTGYMMTLTQTQTFRSSLPVTYHKTARVVKLQQRELSMAGNGFEFQSYI